jgi:ankyrin repeat protein
VKTLHAEFSCHFLHLDHIFYSNPNISAVVTSCIHNEIRLCERLLDGGADLESVSVGMTLLHIAAGNGHADLCAVLLQRGCSVNVLAQYEAHALVMAASYGMYRTCVVLLDHGANPNQRICRIGPLHEAALHGKYGRGPLHEAALYGRLKVCKLLVARGADVDLPSTLTAKPMQKDITPLHCAAYYGNPEVCEFLIAQGADVNARGNAQLSGLLLAGATALCHAAHGGQHDSDGPGHAPEPGSHEDCCKVLLYHGANPNLNRSYNHQDACAMCLR